MKNILKYPGAKNRIANWICSYMPEHNVYLEPYAGSLAVFFHKEPCHIETINDLDGEVVNFYRILREHCEELVCRIGLTPYARAEYVKAYEQCEDDIERARRFCVRCWMGFGCGNLYRNGFKSGQQSHSPNPAKAWAKLPETMLYAAERLKGVQIENLPAVELIKRYDTQDVFMYLDPPYLQELRKKHLYKYEMEDREHEELLEIVDKHPGKVLLSGYDNDLYNDMLHGWNKVQKVTQAEGGRKRVETLWMNYDVEQGQMSLII